MTLPFASPPVAAVYVNVTVLPVDDVLTDPVGVVSVPDPSFDNTVMLGERPPSADLNWGWWSYSDYDTLMATQTNFAAYGGCPSPHIFGPGGVVSVPDPSLDNAVMLGDEPRFARLPAAVDFPCACHVCAPDDDVAVAPGPPLAFDP